MLSFPPSPQVKIFVCRKPVDMRKSFTGFGRLYSLVMSCKLADINVEAYLEDALNRIATTPSSQIAGLTPWGWAAARDAEQLGSDSTSE